MPTVSRDPEQPSLEGRRLDGRNLIDDWLRDKKRRKFRGEYVWNKEQFDAVDPDKVDYLLGEIKITFTRILITYETYINMKSRIELLNK